MKHKYKILKASEIKLILWFLLFGCSATTGILKIHTKPENAKVILDGNPIVENTPFLLKKVKQGKHHIQILLPKYVKLDTSITILRNETNSYFFELEPDFGTLFISTIPDSANISIQSEHLKQPIVIHSPSKVELMPGDYQIEITKGKKFALMNFQVQIKRGKETRRENIRLPAKIASLKIITKPEDCKVWLDGILQEGRTPVSLQNIEPGEHLIRIEHLSYLYQPIEETILTTPRDTTIQFNLEQNFGTLKISSDPEGAEATIESIRLRNFIIKRTAPATIKLPPGNYRVIFEKYPFYEKIAKEIRISKDEILRLDEKLLAISFLKENFVRVPSGTFEMGNKNGNNDEKPVHNVYLDEFWIGKYEISVKDYREFVDATNHPVFSRHKNSNWGKVEREDHPVNFVSWYDAKAYTKWLSQKVGLPCRLPYEAEWEKAARGPQSWLYPWGNEWQQNVTNFCDQNCDKPWRKTSIDDGYPTTAPVKSYFKGKSFYGAFNMAGNVSEWCEDYYSDNYYSYSPKENPFNNEKSEFKVVRGGAWDDFPERLQASYRYKYSPDKRFENVGFRVVISAKKNNF